MRGTDVPDNRDDRHENRAGAIDARLRELIGQPAVSEAYVRFRLDLLAAQRAARRALADPAAATRRPGDERAASLPVRPGDVPFPVAVLEDLLRAIRVASATYGKETGELQRLNAAAMANRTLLPSLVAAAAFGPELEALEALARQADVYPDALLFVGRALAAPCVAEAVRARGGYAAADVHETAPNRCPACASVPSIARLRREDGHRLLTCGLCGSEWEAKRLACACCGTEDYARLGVLRLADTDARWVETCDGCKGYIKTVDERRLPEGEPVLAVVEETATLHLDLLAEREGYIRRVPYVLTD